MEVEDITKLECWKRGLWNSLTNIHGVTGGTTSLNCSPDRYKKALISDNQEGRETPSFDEILIRVKHELSKDEMLEKVVLLVVALFCMGTELRFKS